MKQPTVMIRKNTIMGSFEVWHSVFNGNTKLFSSRNIDNCIEFIKHSVDKKELSKTYESK